MFDRIRTRFERIDPRFSRCQGDEWTERLFTGARWAEGPTYFPAERYLLCSSRLLRRMSLPEEATQRAVRPSWGCS